jgi:hypothetical protein
MVEPLHAIIALIVVGVIKKQYMSNTDVVVYLAINIISNYNY